MSLYHFEIKSGKRGSAVEYIAYITRTGGYAKRGDLLATGHGNMPDCARQPVRFFKVSDKSERINGCPYRALTASLPKNLMPDQNAELSRDLAEILAESKPFLYAFHLPVSSLESESNPHVHVMICDRLPDGIERAPEQIFRRHNSTHPERGGWKKDSGGLTRQQLRDKVLKQRKLVADTINAALARHGHIERVDHRSLDEQGEYRKPERYLGPARIRAMSEDEKKAYVSARREGRQENRKSTGK